MRIVGMLLLHDHGNALESLPKAVRHLVERSSDQPLELHSG
jgi:hypothetical protein